MCWLLWPRGWDPWLQGKRRWEEGYLKSGTKWDPRRGPDRCWRGVPVRREHIFTARFSWAQCSVFISCFWSPKLHPSRREFSA